MDRMDMFLQLFGNCSFESRLVPLQSGLKHVELDFGGLVEEQVDEADQLAVALRKQGSLTSLSVEGPPAFCAKVLSDYLCTHATLRSLRCRDLRRDAVMALTEGLKRTCSLRSLLIHYRDWDVTLGTCAEVLEVNRTIEKIQLAFNEAPNASEVTEFAKALEHNSTLQSLELSIFSGNSNTTGVKLAEALTSNNSLRQFAFYGSNCEQGLDNPECGTPTGVAMLQALAQKSSLQTFSLKWDGFMDDCAVELALMEMFRRNCTLQTFLLDFESVAVGPMHSHDALVKALENNTTLLHISGNYEAAALQTLERNRNLAILKQWRILAALARCEPRFGLRSLRSSNLRSQVFKYVLPLQLPSPPRSFCVIPCDTANVYQPATPQGAPSHDASIPFPCTPDASEQVLQFVVHAEPPAQIHACEASQFVAVQEADFIQQLQMPSVNDQICGQTDEANDALVLCKLNRNPKDLRRAFCEGLPLKRCRDELEAAGHDWQHLSGALFFVHPHQFREAMCAAVELQRHLLPDNIVFAASLEHLVEETMTTVLTSWQPENRRVWAKNREYIAELAGGVAGSIDGQSGRSDPHAGSSSSLQDHGSVPDIMNMFVAERTFLCLARSLYAPETVVQSTTEANSVQGLNPRRVMTRSDSF